MKPHDKPDTTRTIPSRTEIAAAIREALTSNKVARAYLFGSYARGEAGPDSDLDIAVDMEPGSNLLDLVGFQQELEERLGVKVDVTTRQSIDARLKASIEADLIAV
jgi:predicted nucleotidyltransferase